jgi:hypothetical protein
MIHTDRVFGVKEVLDIKTLANQLFHYTWTGCTGYRLDDYLLLNDSFSPDGAQEFAVCRISDGKSIQVETITIVNWRFNENHLEGILTQAMQSQLNMGVYKLQMEDAEIHRCPLCT